MPVLTIYREGIWVIVGFKKLPFSLSSWDTFKTHGGLPPFVSAVWEKNFLHVDGWRKHGNKFNPALLLRKEEKESENNFFQQM
jgi:hypothetical protein